MYLPYFQKRKHTQKVRTEFRGLNRRPGADENEAADMENISAGGYPCLTPRKARGRVRSFTKLNGLLGGDKLCLVDGTDFYYDGYCYGQVADSEKRMVRMGSRIIIFPDKKIFDTQTYSFAGMEVHNQASGVTAQPVLSDGTGFTAVESGTAPEAPADGAYWLDTREGGGLKQWSAAQEDWVAVTTTRVKLSAAGIGAGLAQGEGVHLTGTGELGLDGVVVLQGAAQDAVTVTGLLSQVKTLTTLVKVERLVPDLRYVTEMDNRLWGACADSNELRACKLGDPCCWETYAGLSTDSYAVSVGSDGAFTGAVSFGGAVIFFKDRWLHKLYGTQPSNYQLTATLVQGVQSGADKTICQVDDTLYYAGVDGVYAYDGSLPVKVSWDLGDGALRGKCGGADAGRYLLCAEGADGTELLTYDPRHGMWHREDALDCGGMACAGNVCYLADKTQKLLWSRDGSLGLWSDAKAKMEDAVAWRYETAPQAFCEAEEKYVTRLLVRATLESGSAMDVQIMYDSDGVWHTSAHAEGNGLGVTEVAVFPRRCDHYALAFSGMGGAVVHNCLVEKQRGRG